MIEHSLPTVFLAYSIIALRLSGFRLLKANAHPLSFLIIVQLLTLTAIGTVGLGVYGFAMSYGAEEQISQETKVYVVDLVFNSLSITLLGIALLVNLRLVQPVVYRYSGLDESLLTRLTIVSLIIVVVKLLSVTEIPLILAINGDVIGAAEAKARILTNQEGVTLFGFNYIARSFPYYIYLAAVFLISQRTWTKKRGAIFIANLIIVIIVSLYDAQKATLVFLALLTCWVFYIKNGRVYLLIFGISICAILVLFVFSLMLGLDDLSELIHSAGHRIFFAQAEGMFFIIETIRPTFEYVWLGFPISSFFSLPQIDPAKEVISNFFPTAGDSWVNANSYYIAHAWAIFGELAVVIGPAVVLINIAVILLLFRPLIKKSVAIYYPMLLWFIARLPVVNIFTEFLWLKVVLDALINVLFVGLLLAVFSKKGKK